MNSRKISLVWLVFVSVSVTGCSLFRSQDGTSFNPAKDFNRTSDSITIEEENVIGRAVSAHILGKYAVVDNAPLQAYLNQVGLTVAAASDRPHTYAGYSFVILDTDEVNAMAAPGGIIFITKGLLKTVLNEDALAAILAHEVSHVIFRHGLQSIKPDHFGNFVQVGGQLLSAVDCSGVTQQISIAFQQAIGDVVQTLLSRGYSRDQEFAADENAIKILTKAGFKPEAIQSIFEKLSTMDKERGGWFDTHPSARDRLSHVQSKTAPSAIASEGFEDRTKRFEAVALSN